MAKKTRQPSEKSLRKEILQIDGQIAGLVEKRAQLRASLHSLSPDGISESDFQKATKSLKSLDFKSVRGVLMEVESVCSSLVQPTEIAFLGPQFSYSYLAAVHAFGSSANLFPLGTIQGVFEAVHSGQVEFGVVPLENSTDGRIADTLTMFSKCDVKICKEIHFPIHHCLVGTGSLQELKEIHSKAQALSQCRDWISKNLSSNVKTVPTKSTTEAAEFAKNKGPRIGAIASREAAVDLGLKLLAENIEDQKGNLTRFVVIVGSHPDTANSQRQSHLPGKTGKDKTSIMFEVLHSPGSLADVMNIFKRASLNLTWIESFPKPGVFSEYTFFAELQGHQQETRVRNALRQLEKKTETLTILGSYPEYESS